MKTQRDEFYLKKCPKFAADTAFVYDTAPAAAALMKENIKDTYYIFDMIISYSFNY